MCVLSGRGVNIDGQSDENFQAMFTLVLELWVVIPVWYKPSGNISRSGKGKGGQGILAPLEWTLERAGQTVKASGTGTWGTVPVSSGEQENKQKALFCGPGSTHSD